MAITLDRFSNYPPDHQRAKHFANDAHGNVGQGEHAVANSFCAEQEDGCINRCGDGGGEQHPRGEFQLRKGKDGPIDQF